MVNGQWPKGGQIVRMPNLARTYEDLGQFGKSAFYNGRIAKSVVDCVQNGGGFLSLEDLSAHESEWLEPIYTLYKSKSDQITYKVLTKMRPFRTVSVFRSLFRFGKRR